MKDALYNRLWEQVKISKNRREEMSGTDEDIDKDDWFSRENTRGYSLPIIC